jgi:poly-beta-1,6-N-acetyl-D-glucosamine N-deacetylase
MGLVLVMQRASLLLRSSLAAIVFFVVGLLGSTANASGIQAGSPITVLCYHDITDDPANSYPDAVTTQEFSMQMTWLKTQGYTVISAQDYFDNRAGKKELPEKSVLLTFDDGYLSYYTHVFPLLRALNYPSVVGVIGSWSSQREVPGAQLKSPVQGLARNFSILNATQIKELSSSGLVEVASHTYDLHRGIFANPQGSLVPAAITQELTTSGYESEQAYQRRIAADLQKNSTWIEGVTGKKPRVMIWPYGRYNAVSLTASTETGHTLSLGLDNRNFLTKNNEVLGRVYVTGGLRISRFADMVRVAAETPARRHVTVQVTRAALTSDGQLSDPWLSGLVKSVYDTGANLVYLSPFLSGESSCTALFPNTHVPIFANILSKISWQLQTRTDAKVLLDIRPGQCQLSEESWTQLTREMLEVGNSNGLVVRGTPEQTELLQKLVAVARERDYTSLVATTQDVPDQSFKLVTVSGCQRISGSIFKGPRMQYEVDTSTCQTPTVLEQLLRVGVRDFGTFNGPLRQTGFLDFSGEQTLRGLIGFKS